MKALRLISRTGVMLIAGVLAFAHPMGNLSVNHYAKLMPSSNGVEIIFALDLAEIPTFELLQAWNLTKDAPPDELQKRSAAQAREWVASLEITEAGKKLAPKIERTELAVVDGAGNLPVFRITTHLHVAAGGGRLEFADRNYPARAGWREIVIQPGTGADLSKASKSATDISQGLTAYPQDPTLAPPQDASAWFEWTVAKGPVSSVKAPVVVAAPIAPVPAAPAAPVGARPAEAASHGTVQRNDAISKLLRTENLSWGAMGLLLALAFWFGALHALEPGHGKTMVAAYLVGEKSNAKHALLLGGMVTFTHTISVFVLGIVTMFLSQYIMPEKISKVLGIISGVSIIWIGSLMLLRRVYKLTRKDQDHAHAITHSHGGTTHTHGGSTHSHAPEGDISVGNLIALGASGGLVPCPSALILLLSAISIGRAGLGMVLLLAFSLGLAIVLTSTGLVVLYAKNFFPKREGPQSSFFKFMPIVSAVAILLIGIVMTGLSLGWLPANRFIG